MSNLLAHDKKERQNVHENSTQLLQKIYLFDEIGDMNHEKYNFSPDPESKFTHVILFSNFYFQRIQQRSSIF